MSEKLFIEALLLRGFRAYLAEQQFPLFRGRIPISLAVFAPNAKGKSSLVDALEFYFSEEGTLDRIGPKRSGTKAGPEALEHIEARERGIASGVSLKLRGEHGTILEGERAVSNPPSPRTPAATEVLDRCRTQFILRGHELRGFVEHQTPQQRYEEVSDWFGLSVLRDVQRNLRALRVALRQAIDDPMAKSERLRDLKRLTTGEISSWDDAQVIDWLNKKYLGVLGDNLELRELSAMDPGYRELAHLSAQAEKRIGLAAVREAAKAISTVDQPAKVEEDYPTGALREFVVAVEELKRAEVEEEREKAKSQRAIFRELWETAKQVLEQQVPLDTCPVCNTALEQTTSGSIDGVRAHLIGCLDELDDYKKSVERLDQGRKSWRTCQSTLAANLETLRSSLDAIQESEAASFVESARKELLASVGAEVPESLTSLSGRLSELRVRVDDQIDLLEKNPEASAYSRTLKVVQDLVELKEGLKKIESINISLELQYRDLERMETRIAKELRRELQERVDSLKDDTSRLYSAIQSTAESVPEIQLQLDEETKQPYLNLFVDFADNRRAVVPSGYLSDSQIHTLALSLRLAAIRLLNVDFPVIVLDDVVTSYDADHRLAIASMLVREFSDFQIIVVSHDERFFAYLKDQLPQQRWIFKRITNLKGGFGPKFHDHRVPDAEVERRHEEDKSAARDMRQIEEEWLLDLARGFGVDVRIREVHHPYRYDRAELAGAIHRFVKSKAKVPMPLVEGNANPFLESLQRGELENFAAHFRDDPQAWSSVGDEKIRWKQFTEFREYFRCNCGSASYQRPVGVSAPICKKCERAFVFGIDSLG